MATAQLDAIRKVFDRVRTSTEPGHGDGELLTRYRADRDQEAFGSLVRRHGPMVLGVCRRVLRDAHAADDAFQATFLVLAKKAGAVRPPGRLAPWLYGVAYRTALKARGRAFRRQQVEHEYAAEAAARGEPARDTAELLPIIDEQLNALPEKYRDPLVLCGVQGLNKAEAAEKLGLPEGTVSSRLARAREMLRDRLTRRGVIVPGATFAALLTTETLQAAVPASLATAASVTAAGSVAVPATILALAHEVTRSMSLLKLQFLGVIALSASLATGGLVALNADDKKPTGEKPVVVKPDGQKPVVKPDGEKPVKPAPDGEKPAQPGKKVRKTTGHVAAVDAKAGTVTVLRMGEGGLREDIVKLAADAKVIVDGKAAKLDDVPKGSTVEFSITPLAKEGSGFAEVAEVTVDRSKVVWVVKEADAASVTLLGGGRRTQLPDQVIKLAANAKIVIGGKPAKPTDLQPGDMATILLNADRSAATSVSVGTKAGLGDGDKPGVKPAKPIRFGGKVAAVDAAARSISLAAKGDGGKEIVVKLTTDAKVSIDGKDAKIGDIKPGTMASVNIVTAKDGQPREANEVTIAGGSFSGVIKQIDTTSVTVGNEKTARVLKLVSGGKVMVNGKEAKFSDLKVGDRVTVTLTSDELAAVLIVAGEKPAGDKPKPAKPDGEDQ